MANRVRRLLYCNVDILKEPSKTKSSAQSTALDEVNHILLLNERILAPQVGVNCIGNEAVELE